MHREMKDPSTRAEMREKNEFTQAGLLRMEVVLGSEGGGVLDSSRNLNPQAPLGDLS